MMTIKEAILKSLDDIKALANHSVVTQHIIDNAYYDFSNALTPKDTVSAQLGDFIRKGDSRVQRIMQKGATYSNYLSKYESLIKNDQLEESNITGKTTEQKSYTERSLHKLLASYLKSSGINSKTIFHEKSNTKDSNQVWTHPDMVGIDFLKLKSSYNQSFLKLVNRGDLFKLQAYEIKRVINSDNDLKQAYFQAVSNSSWANYGYLVDLKIEDRLKDEMYRLNQYFGIGIIELNANPYISKITYSARFKEIDFSTLDKLCVMNAEFGKFIEHVDKLISVDERYYTASEKEFDNYCDTVFENDTEVQEYCL